MNESAVDPHRLLALFSAQDLDALIDEAFRLLQAAVECEFVSAFYRNTGNGLLKQRDSRGREGKPAFMRRFAELTPALPAAMASPGIKVLTTRAVMPLSDTELKRTAFYREIMQPEGWRHAVSLCFWGDPLGAAPIFVASVYRSGGQRDFSERDVASLNRIHPFLDCAVNRIYEREAATVVRDAMAMSAHDGARGLAILDGNLRLVQANPVAREFIAAWMHDAVPPNTDSSVTVFCLPPVLAAECRELREEWRTLVRADPDATDLRHHLRISHARVPGLSASITMVCPNAAGLGEPTFVIEIESRVHGAVLDTSEAAASVLQNMTATERAVATALADGLSNQEIADRLGKSVGAVKFLLHRIYRKTGVPSRAALVAVVLRSR